jgi:N-terminal half of MaoC dehydratase
MSAVDRTTSELNLAFGTWEDAEALVGAQLSQYVGVDPVNAADIRRRLEVLEWDCPLHYDHDLARELGHPSPPSPVTMLKTWVMPAYWRPGEPRSDAGCGALLPRYSYLDIPAPGSAIFATNVKTVYHTDVYDGDALTAYPRFRSISRKSTSVGDGAFLVFETDYRNQDGKLVATEEFTIFRFEPEADDAD